MSKRQEVYLFFKRLLDCISSFICILLFLPLLILISIIIKFTSKGPVLFVQLRIGKDKKPFKIFKFRTMKKEAPEIPSNELSPEEIKKLSTKIGVFLRKTSIDELPQIFNIFIGQMSFVGPRPGALKNEDYLVRERDKYQPSPFSVRPGLTGYAQTHGRRNDSPTKARLDHYYVKNISFLLDLRIIILTIGKLFLFEGS